ncbi:type II toxin-antitoxin system RelE/ParE family toxin [Rhizobium tubonense]|uniref:Plasmid stabilization protein ParE n=1 Tax=Rhizobium tubonense TaxID=484088 RepID=A0A2W4CAB7_9HYPH|nr:plasmid stabilization protein ParE [Rhizobium tubonense]
MRIVWAPFARDDLISIRSYISQHNPKAARLTAVRILHTVNLLSERPELGMSTHRDDVRRLLVSNSVYSIIYRLRESDIEIIEIFDGRQAAPRSNLTP